MANFVEDDACEMTHMAKQTSENYNKLRISNYVQFATRVSQAAGSVMMLLVSVGHAAAEEPVASKRISVSYFGESFSHPGARLGYEGSMWKTGPFEIVLAGSLGLFLEPSARRGFFGLVEMGGRLTTGSGLLFDLRLGIGYLNIAWDESVPRPQPALSTSHFMPSTLLGLGYDFKTVAGVPFGILVRSGMIGRYSTDNLFDGAYVLDAGLFFTLK